MVGAAGMVAGGLSFTGAAGDAAVQEHIRPAVKLQASLDHVRIGIPLDTGGVHGGAGENTHQQRRNGSGNQRNGRRQLLFIGGAGHSLPHRLAVLGRLQVFLAGIQIFIEAAVEIIPPEMDQEPIFHPVPSRFGENVM